MRSRTIELSLSTHQPDFDNYGLKFIPAKNSLYHPAENTELKLYNGYWFEVPITKNKAVSFYTAKEHNLSHDLFIYSSTKHFKEKNPSISYTNTLYFNLSSLHKYLIELYASLLQEAGVNITTFNEPIAQSTNKKPRKKSIPPSLKLKVWNKYIGEEIGKAKCLCCKVTDIYQASFSCGHIIAENNGGELSIHNLKPICVSCNSSMGTKNMNDYIKEYGF